MCVEYCDKKVLVFQELPWDFDSSILKNTTLTGMLQGLKIWGLGAIVTWDPQIWEGTHYTINRRTWKRGPKSSKIVRRHLWIFF